MVRRERRFAARNMIGMPREVSFPRSERPVQIEENNPALY